jgi:hypothetical protein
MAGAADTGAQGDTITLTLPASEDLVGVAMLVLGGIAVRLDLTFESLEDLELAVESLLGRVRDGEDATLVVDVGDRSLTASVGPVDGAAVRAELDDESDAVGLRRVLHTVADRYELIDRDGGAWLSIEKGVGRGVPSGEQG